MLKFFSLLEKQNKNTKLLQYWMLTNEEKKTHILCNSKNFLKAFKNFQPKQFTIRKLFYLNYVFFLKN